MHCAVISNDRIVYVCDRRNNRIQSFTPQGKFIKEVQVSPKTLGDGSTWDIAFSKDPQQKFMYLADGHDEKVWILDRASMEVLTSFGSGGKQPGQFYAIHSIDTDSRGNIYTTETYDGRRLQRFMYKGTMMIEKGRDQGTVWPRDDGAVSRRRIGRRGNGKPEHGEHSIIINHQSIFISQRG